MSLTYNFNMIKIRKEIWTQKVTIGMSPSNILWDILPIQIIEKASIWNITIVEWLSEQWTKRLLGNLTAFVINTYNRHTKYGWKIQREIIQLIIQNCTICIFIPGFIPLVYIGWLVMFLQKKNVIISEKRLYFFLFFVKNCRHTSRQYCEFTGKMNYLALFHSVLLP